MKLNFSKDRYVCITNYKAKIDYLNRLPVVRLSGGLAKVTTIRHSKINFIVELQVVSNVKA